MAGTLYVVSLPIGNLEDITLRAIRTLRQVDLIVAEDSRRTRALLSHYRIKTPFSLSLYQGVERERVEPCLDLLRAGKSLALVSDAGTPLVNDPGFPLVRAATAAALPVVPVPGACAALAALVASGLATDQFVFGGAVPRKEGERRAFVAGLAREGRTTVLYESPHRLLGTLTTVAAMLPDRRLVVARELTKVHEEFVRGTAAEVSATFEERGEARGEIVLVLSGAEARPEEADFARVESVLSLLEEEGISKSGRERVLREVLGLGRNEAYRLAHRA